MPARQSKTSQPALEAALSALPGEPREMLCQRWGELYGRPPPKNFPRILLELGIAYRLQEQVHGGLAPEVRKQLLATEVAKDSSKGSDLNPGTTLVRTWKSVTHSVTVLESGFVYKGKVYSSLTQVAGVITGSHWSGPAFFGLKSPRLIRKPA